MSQSPNLQPSGKYDPKASNPKDIIGTGKLPLDLVPDTGIVYAALAFLEGALKYGKFNWRIAGVRWSVYEAALKRHMVKVKEGEWKDPVTGVPHIGSMLACLMILADAAENGKLIDDRPPSMLTASDFVDSTVKDVAQLKRVFAKHDPKQYTIEDTEYVEGSGEPADSVGPQTAASVVALREDAQSLPGRDGRRVVLGPESGSVGGVEMAGFYPQNEAEALNGPGLFKNFVDDPINVTYSPGNLCNLRRCTKPECVANRLAQGQAN